MTIAMALNGAAAFLTGYFLTTLIRGVFKGRTTWTLVDLIMMSLLVLLLAALIADGAITRFGEGLPG